MRLKSGTVRASCPITSGDKAPCHRHRAHRKCSSQPLAIYHRPGGWNGPGDMSAKATCDMKILSAEWRTGGAPPGKIPSLFSEMKQHLFLTSVAQVYAFNLMRPFSHWVLLCRSYICGIESFLNSSQQRQQIGFMSWTGRRCGPYDKTTRA